MTALTLKLFGGALLTAAGGLLGLGHNAALKRRAGLLRTLDTALGMLSEELTLLKTPLPRVFSRLRDRPFFELLDAGFGTEPLEKLWRRAAETLELPPGDRETLAALGAVMGRCSAERQAAEIDLARRRLEESAAAAERELAGRARSLPGLGASLGAMLAVILF